MRVKNCAGLSVELHSPPILIDKTVPSSGVVKDGSDFSSDVLWVNDNTNVTGLFDFFLNFQILLVKTNNTCSMYYKALWI